MTLERRTYERIPTGFYVHQVIEDDLHRCFITDLSPVGLFMQRPVDPFDRRSNVVQIELPLPGLHDTLWARAEVVYDRIDSLFHGTAVAFTDMAQKHHRQLRGWIDEVQHGYLSFPVSEPARGGGAAGTEAGGVVATGGKVQVLRPGAAPPVWAAA